MCKKTLLMFGVLGFAGSAWAAIGDPYIGEEAIGWQTTSAVTVHSSNDGGYLPWYSVGNVVNGGAFQANGAPGSKLPFLGAGYTTDGWSHSSSAAYNTWLIYPISPNSVSPVGVSSKAWVEFTFDKVYTIKDITVWNGGGQEGNTFQNARAWKDTVISWSTDGISWNNMNYTLNLSPVDADLNFFTPSDPAISLLGNSDAKYVVFSGTSNYGDTQFMTMSEVRFNLTQVPEPSTLSLLGLGGLGLLLRRKR